MNLWDRQRKEQNINQIALVARVFDDISLRYDNAFQRSVDLAENALAFSLIAKLPGALDGELLDLGCGTGLLLDYLQPRSYTGIDISEGMLSIARGKHPSHLFMREDMQSLSIFADMQFDAVVSTFGSFSYCFDPMTASCAMLRVLRPGGYFQIHALSWRYKTRKSYITPQVPIIGFTRNDLKHLFEHSGFKELRISGFNVLSCPPLLRIEAQTLGKWFPDLCYFLVITGRKSA